MSLEPNTYDPVADTGRPAAAPGDVVSPVIANGHPSPGAPGVRSARQIPKEESIIKTAKRIVANQIIELSPELPSPRLFRKYLLTLSLEDLQVRRAELLNPTPELFNRTRLMSRTTGNKRSRIALRHRFITAEEQIAEERIMKLRRAELVAGFNAAWQIANRKS